VCVTCFDVISVLIYIEKCKCGLTASYWRLLSFRLVFLSVCVCVCVCVCALLFPAFMTQSSSSGLSSVTLFSDVM